METHVSTSQMFWPYLWNPIFMKNTHAIETNGSGRLVLLFLSSVPHMEGRPVEVNVLQRKCQRNGTAGRSLDLICDAVSFCGHMIIGLTKNGILAPPEADLPSPEPDEKPRFSPWAVWSTKPRTPGTCEPAILPHPEPVYHLPLCAACTQNAHDLIPSQKSLRTTIISATVA